MKVVVQARLDAATTILHNWWRPSAGTRPKWCAKRSAGWLPLIRRRDVPASLGWVSFLRHSRSRLKQDTPAGIWRLKPILLDTGVIVALLDRSERRHGDCVRGTFQIPIQVSQCAAAIQRILRKYRDQKADLADACLIHLASELRSGEILTLDRDFAVYRWGANRPFRPLFPLW